MKRRTLMMMLAIVGAFLLSPLPALAAVCFRASPLIDIAVIEVEGAAGPFFSLIGEVVNWCGTNTSMPLSGSAHIRPDGNAHFGVSIQGVVGTTCAPGWYQGTLNPPTFDTGTGFHRNAFGSTTTLTFSAVSCPTIPQEAGTLFGPSGGEARP